MGKVKNEYFSISRNWNYDYDSNCIHFLYVDQLIVVVNTDWIYIGNSRLYVYYVIYRFDNSNKSTKGMMIMNDCPEYLVYQENGMWRVACVNGKLYALTGLYETREQAIEAVEKTGSSYQVVEGRSVYELF